MGAASPRVEAVVRGDVEEEYPPFRYPWNPAIPGAYNPYGTPGFNNPCDAAAVYIEGLTNCIFGADAAAQALTAEETLILEATYGQGCVNVDCTCTFKSYEQTQMGNCEFRQECSYSCQCTEQVTCRDGLPVV